MNKRPLHLIYGFVRNFLFVSCVLTYYSIWDKGSTYPALIFLNNIYFTSKKVFFLFYTYKVFENSLRRIQSYRDLYFYIRYLCAICESIRMPLSWCFIRGTISYIYIWISNKPMVFCLIWIIYCFSFFCQLFFLHESVIGW